MPRLMHERVEDCLCGQNAAAVERGPAVTAQRVRVEQRLRRVLVPAVARVHDRGLRPRRDTMRRARARISR